MRTFLFLLVIIMGFTQCKQSEKTPAVVVQHDCEYFKTGTFTLIDSTENLNTTIVRDNVQQTETNNITGAITKASITWTDPCTYQMKYLESTSQNAGNIIGKTLIVRMVNIEGETYNYTSKLKGSNYTSQNVITKVE